MKIMLLILFIATIILMAHFADAEKSRLSKRLAALRSPQPARKE